MRYDNIDDFLNDHPDLGDIAGDYDDIEEMYEDYPELLDLDADTQFENEDDIEEMDTELMELLDEFPELDLLDDIAEYDDGGDWYHD